MTFAIFEKHLAISPSGATVQDRVKYYRNSYALDRMALLFDHLERSIITPNHTILANVNSRSRSLCCRPSVCLSSACNACAPYSGGWNFRQYFYGIWYAGHPLTSERNFTEIVPEEPLRRGS